MNKKQKIAKRKQKKRRLKLKAKRAELLKNKKVVEFDGMWSSSLTDSATKGKPDNSSVDFSDINLILTYLLLSFGSVSKSIIILCKSPSISFGI